MSGPRQLIGNPRRRSPTGVVVFLAIALLFMSGCARADTDDAAPDTSHTQSSVSTPAAVRPLGQDEDGAISPRAIVAALALRGFLVPNMLDITDQVCPAAGCDHSVVTDTMRITSFSNATDATRYAQERGLRHWRNVAVAFPPVVSASDQDRYWSAIMRIFP